MVVERARLLQVLILVFLLACAQGRAPSPVRLPRSVSPARSAVTDGASSYVSPGYPQKGLAVYRSLAEEHTFLVSAAQAAVLRSCGDRLAQEIEIYRGVQEELSLVHTLAMGSIGALVSGGMCSLWLRHLERRLGGEKSPVAIVRKTVADFCCWAPLANSAYLFGVPFACGAGVDGALANLQHEFISCMTLELGMFMPYNLVAFSLIPLALRPAVAQLVALVFTVVLATKC